MSHPDRRHELEAAALQTYCPVHRAEPGHLCTLLDTGGAPVTTGICSTRMATTTLETPR